MELKQAAQVIRDNVTMDQILDLYGYQVKHGFMCCPFHGEKEPSLKVYGGGKGWHCFGCNKGGSVIDFVMEQEGCNFRTAILAIDNALRLGLMDQRETVFQAAEERRVQHWLDQVAEAFNACLDELQEAIEREQLGRAIYVRFLEDQRADDPQSITADEWTRILSAKTEDEYDEYRKDRINEIREEVAAWRRSRRRTERMRS